LEEFGEQENYALYAKNAIGVIPVHQDFNSIYAIGLTPFGLQLTDAKNPPCKRADCIYILFEKMYLLN